MIPGLVSASLLRNASGGAGPHAAAFLARTSGLDATHTNAYINFINGLDTFNLFAKMDSVKMYFTQDSATALLNLVSTNYGSTIINTPVFTADRGFTSGTNGGINDNFDPITATSPIYAQNSAHCSVFSVTDPGESSIAIFGSISSVETEIYPRYTDGNAYFRCNSSNIAGVVNGSPIGHFISNRPNSTTVEGYIAGARVLNNTGAASGVPADHGFSFGAGISGPLVSPHQLGATTIGGGLTTTDAANLYSLVRAFATAVGVP